MPTEKTTPAEENASAENATLPELKTLIEKNIKWSQVVYEQSRKINRRLTWMVVGDYVRLFLIIAPLIFAAIFLPPVIKDFWEQYGKVLSGMTGGGGADAALNISPGQIQELLKQFGQ